MAEDSPNDDWVEELLRADRATAVRDDGFVERLLAELPMRRRDRRTWITPLMTAVGTILAVLSLGGPATALSVLEQTQVAGVVPLIVFLPFVIVLVSSVWAISECRGCSDAGPAPHGLFRRRVRMLRPKAADSPRRLNQFR